MNLGVKGFKGGQAYACTPRLIHLGDGGDIVVPKLYYINISHVFL